MPDTGLSTKKHTSLSTYAPFIQKIIPYAFSLSLEKNIYISWRLLAVTQLNCLPTARLSTTRLNVLSQPLVILPLVMGLTPPWGRPGPC